MKKYLFLVLISLSVPLIIQAGDALEGLMREVEGKDGLNPRKDHIRLAFLVGRKLKEFPKQPIFTSDERFHYKEYFREEVARTIQSGPQGLNDLINAFYRQMEETAFERVRFQSLLEVVRQLSEQPHSLNQKVIQRLFLSNQT